MKYTLIILLFAACQVKDPPPVTLPTKSIGAPANDTVPDFTITNCDTCKFTFDEFIGRGQREWIFQYNSDTLNFMLSITEAGTVTIQGDTIFIIKKLMEYINKDDSVRNGIRDALQSALQSAVDFTNTVGAEYKRGEKWEAYQRELKKQGYTIKVVHDETPIYRYAQRVTQP